MSPVPPASTAPIAEGPASEILPRRFGGYQLFDRIGRGGMAEIFLARAAAGLGADRLVVVKQIHASLSRDEGFAQMFIEEAKLCAGLRHANVVQVLDLGREGGLLYMAMEYVEGFDLHQLLTRCSKAKVALPAEFALFVVREVLAALDFAHRATDAKGSALGIVHRDVSPSNVLVSLEGEVKLCDFGIARAAGRAAEEPDARSGARVVGKSAYMSPEHARGEALDGRADVFAAGILLWELCAGRRLYRGSEEQMLELARSASIPALPERGLPEHARLQAILTRALAPSRDDRFASAAELLVALDEYTHAARLFASQIRFGAFLTEHFGGEFVVERRARERAARALELGPPVRLEPVALPTSPPPASPTVAPLVPAPQQRTSPRAERPALADVTTSRTRVHDDDTVPEAPSLAVLERAVAQRRAQWAMPLSVLAVIAVLASIVALVLAR